MALEKYTVQIVVIREIEVEATGLLQAERKAFQELGPRDKDCAIAHKAFPPNDPDTTGGALAEDLFEAWRYARDHFHAIRVVLQ